MRAFKYHYHFGCISNEAREAILTGDIKTIKQCFSVRRITKLTKRTIKATCGITGNKIKITFPKVV